MFVVYSHERYNPEADMFKICSCDTEDEARYIIDALEYRDAFTYDYYIVKKENSQK